MNEVKKILHLEDNIIDAELVKSQLRNDDIKYEILNVETKEEFISALEKSKFDLIISDYTLPAFFGMEALRIAKKKTPGTPFIFFSGTMGEDKAVNGLRNGATDYIVKDNLSLLVPALKRAFHEVEETKKAKETEEALLSSETKFRDLFDNMSSGVAVYMAVDNGNDFIFLDLNQAGQKNSSVDINEIRGKRVTEVFPAVKEIGLLNIFRNVWRTGEPEILPSILYKDNRISQWVENYVYKLNSGEIIAVYDDISKRKAAENDLRESKLQLEMTIKASNTGLWDWNLLTNEVYYSPEWKSQIGYEDHEISNNFSEWRDRVHPDDLETALSTVNNFIKNQSPNYENEFRFLHKDGSYRWILTRASLINDNEGRPIRMLGSHLDITEKKKSELALRKSEERYRNLFENMLDGFALHEMIFDENNKPLDYCFLELNPAFEKMTGLKTNDIVGKTVLDVMPDTEQYWIDSYGEVVKTGIPIKFNNYSKQLDKYFEVVAFSTGNNKFVTIFSDITENKKAEESLRESETKFKSLVNNSPNGIYLTDQDGKCIFVNPAWCKMAGLTEDEAMGNGWVNGLHPEDKDLVFSGWAKMIKTKSEWNNEYRFRDKNNKITIVSGKVTPIFDSNDILKGYLGTNVDITDQKNSEIALRESEKELHLLAGHLQSVREEERAAIAREIHDELGQVLTTLKMSISLMGKEISHDGKIDPGYLKSELAGMIQIIDNSVIRVRKLITELRPELLDKLGLLPALEWQVEEFQKKSGIKCSFKSNVEELDISPEKGIVIFRVMQEAMNNIRRHSNAAEASITLDASNEEVKMQIIDNGKGFSQTASAPKKTFGILGMRERASLINGKFNISGSEKGTIVTLIIPL